MRTPKRSTGVEDISRSQGLIIAAAAWTAGCCGYAVVAGEARKAKNAQPVCRR